MNSLYKIILMVLLVTLGSCAKALKRSPEIRQTSSKISEQETLATVGFVDIKTINPDILVQAIYNTDWNFIGRPIKGYLSNKCFLTLEAAKALSEVQKEVSKSGYSLLAFDCYRPQKAVTEFATWAKVASDKKMKAVFYPEEPKATLFKQGYIASKSGHSRGSTIDLTLVKISQFKPEELIKKLQRVQDCRYPKGLQAIGLVEMGTTVDCFSVLANTDNPLISKEAKQNRQILKTAMERYGFKNYSKEWWHYTLNNETYKNEYFDFEVQ